MTADLAELLSSWELSLRAERKSPQTVKSYGDGVRQFLAWCEREGRSPVLDRPSASGFVASLLDGGAEAATARARQLAIRRFSAWLTEEQEIPRDELVGIKAPKLDQKIVEPLTDVQVRAMVHACAGTTDNPFWDRRDEALIRFMVETGCRAGEVATMLLPDVDLMQGIAIVRRGKGGKGRSVPFGPQTTKALDRYIRARRAHRLAATDRCGLATAARTSDTTRCTRRSRSARRWPVSPASIPTGCATPPRTDGSPPAAPRAG